MTLCTSPALAAKKLSRVFVPRGQPPRTALASVDLVLPAGGVHALLGPNGAGKTTLCRIASTVLIPTGGSLEILGQDVVENAKVLRRQIAIVFGGDRGLYDRLTARENLVFWCSMYGFRRREGKNRAADLLTQLGLSSRADERVETFSRGMKQRLHLARGLVADPKLLILDEPTVGMDPVSAVEFRELVAGLRNEGRTVLLTTHNLQEAEALADSVTVMDRGRVLTHVPSVPQSGTLESLYFDLVAGDKDDNRGMEV